MLSTALNVLNRAKTGKCCTELQEKWHRKKARVQDTKPESLIQCIKKILDHTWMALK